MRRKDYSNDPQKKQALEHTRCIISPGYLAVSQSPSLLCSVCGNGVIVTLWDPVKRNGGMAHCIFPQTGFTEQPTNYHASIAIPSLIQQMLDLHPYAARFEAQIFGGGNAHGAAQRRAVKVIKMIKKMLHRFKVDVISENIGGSVGRKIVFDTNSGDILVIHTKRVRKTDWLPEYLVT